MSRIGEIIHPFVSHACFLVGGVALYAFMPIRDQVALHVKPGLALISFSKRSIDFSEARHDKPITAGYVHLVRNEDICLLSKNVLPITTNQEEVHIIAEHKLTSKLLSLLAKKARIQLSPRPLTEHPCREKRRVLYGIR